MKITSMRLNGAVFVLAVICLFGLPVQGALYSGGGTEADPYIIDTAAEMNDIGNNTGHWGSYFLLTADIDLSAFTGTAFNIIGNSTIDFTGVFDGNGHTISNFTYSSTDVNGIGLFGYVDGPNAGIKNIGLIDPNVDAGTGKGVGSLAGRIHGSRIITGCWVEGGSVSGREEVGGLVGWTGAISNTISNCYAATNVSGDTYVGGLVGFCWWGTISNCYAAGSVDGSVDGNNGAVGGLVGGNYAMVVSNSYATGSVSGGDSVGGLVGWNGGTVSNSYATGSVSGGDDVGGLVGYNQVYIYYCYATGSVSGTAYVGGLVGGNYNTASNSYATGSVSGGSQVGGLVGRNYDGMVSNSYSAGDVNGTTYVGGLIGYDGPSDYTKSFWDNTVNPDVNGIGNGSDPNVIGESTANMQTESTFTDAGWDFVGETVNGPNDIWRLCNEGAEYPQLNWQFLLGDFVCPDGVDFVDFAILGLAWRSEPDDVHWNSVCDISEPNDSVIDGLDLDVFVENWLTGF